MHRIVLVVGQLDVGGLERQAWLLARGLDRSRFAVTVVSLQKGGAFADRLRQDGVSVVQIARRGRRDWRRLFRLALLLRGLRPHLVYSFNYEANAYTRLAALPARVPIVLTGERGVYMSRPQATLERCLGPFTDRVICNADAVRRDLVVRVGLPSSKVLVVRNGVEIPAPAGEAARVEARRRLGLPSEGLVVGTVARLHPVKNLPLLLEVAGAFLDRSDLRFCIIGGGPEEAALRSLAARPPLKGRAIIAGERADARDLLAGFDIFLLTSESEGLPNTLMEAMAQGLPCICTDVGGCRELIQDGVNGYVVPPGDAATMVRHVRRLADDHDLRVQLGAAARERAESEFSVGRMVAQIESILTSLLEARQMSSRRTRGARDRPQSIGL